MNDDTNLADLLALNLHNFEDEVRGIVDKATKELGMEKVLKELDVTWSQMEFEYESHMRTGIPLLKSSEELIETLEDNQVREKKVRSLSLLKIKCIRSLPTYCFRRILQAREKKKRDRYIYFLLSLCPPFFISGQ